MVKTVELAEGEFILGTEGQFNIRKSTNAFLDINNLKEKKLMIISKDFKKSKS